MNHNRPDSILEWTLDESKSRESANSLTALDLEACPNYDTEIDKQVQVQRKKEYEYQEKVSEMNTLIIPNTSPSSGTGRTSPDNSSLNIDEEESSSFAPILKPEVSRSYDDGKMAAEAALSKTYQTLQRNDPKLSDDDRKSFRNTSSDFGHNLRRVFSHHSSSSILPYDYGTVSPTQQQQREQNNSTPTGAYRDASLNNKDKNQSLDWQSRRQRYDCRTFSFDGMMLQSTSLQTNEHGKGLGPNQQRTLIKPQNYVHPKLSQDPSIYGSGNSEVTELLSSYQQEKRNHYHDNFLIPNNDSGDEYDYDRQYHDHKQKIYDTRNEKKKSKDWQNDFFYYAVYALLNTLMSVPSLYGYASVIFNHIAFLPYLPTLSKLVIFSSGVHQFTFVCISSISFAKAEVQDAGLLFLSCMSQFIANRIIDEQGTIEEIISTTVIGLGIATACLGCMLMIMGKFNYANAVSYLPLPVVGGYLAFIGYFCVIAGVGLCISKSLVDESFVTFIETLMDRQSLTLAIPGILSGLLMMIVARYAKSDMTLPAMMVLLPSVFYIVLHFSDYTMDDARQNQWVGEVQPHTSLVALFDLLDFNLVRWDLVFSSKMVTIWFGMVFVVSFSSCLDVAAISLDMGEPLHVNNELVTVGLSNVLSGVFLGQTGSYIFSQTILTYRTGFHSRWIGILCTLAFLYFALSTVNLLEIVPLYFLGSTLVFIGFDLLYEWLVEVAHKLLLSEYIVLLATFVAIQMKGINGGIIVGLIVAVVEFVITSSQTPSLRRVLKQSRAVWELRHRKLMQDVVYDSRNPKIITLEITETVFFGSSLQLFHQICDEAGIDPSPEDMKEIKLASPHLHSSPSLIKQHKKGRTYGQIRSRPRYLVLDMILVPNVDASAARSCFLQLAKICSKNGIVVCACGANSRVDWILRSHEVTYTSEEEEIVKSYMLDPLENVNVNVPTGKLVLFPSVNECLELCENQLIYEYKENNKMERPILGSRGSKLNLMSCEDEQVDKTPLSVIFGRILGMDCSLLGSFDSCGEETEFHEGQKVFIENEVSDGFFVVLRGSVTITRTEEQNRLKRPQPMVSLSIRSLQQKEEAYPTDVFTSSLSVGGIFGYVDFAIHRRRSFNAVCTSDGTIIAKISQTTIDRLKRKDKALHHIIEKVLLQASLIELANINVS